MITVINVFIAINIVIMVIAINDFLIIFINDYVIITSPKEVMFGSISYLVYLFGSRKTQKVMNKRYV